MPQTNNIITGLDMKQLDRGALGTSIVVLFVVVTLYNNNVTQLNFDDKVSMQQRFFHSLFYDKILAKKLK